MDDIHSCSYHCQNPMCIKAQRDELRESYFKQLELVNMHYLNGWNNALDEAAARIGEMKGFGPTTQYSFSVYIRGLKK